MLVQMSFVDVMREVEVMNQNNPAGEVFCSLCNGSIGVVDRGELKYLVYEHPDDILCFDCENREPRMMKKMGAALCRRLIEGYDVDNVSELPLSAAPAWVNSEGFILQLEPMVGWLVWYPDHYGITALRRIKVPHDVAAGLRADWNLSPMLLV